MIRGGGISLLSSFQTLVAPLPYTTTSQFHICQRFKNGAYRMVARFCLGSFVEGIAEMRWSRLSAARRSYINNDVNHALFDHSEDAVK